MNILGLLDSALCLECLRGRMALCKERKKERMKFQIVVLNLIDTIYFTVMLRVVIGKNTYES